MSLGNDTTSGLAAWQDIEALLDRDPFGSDFNTAHEICTRYAADPSRVALTVRHDDGSVDRWTYRELDRLAAKAARVFARAGLKPGDRVGGLLTRQVESWITALAVWRSGLVYVPLFGGFAPDAIGLRLDAAAVRAIVVDQRYRPALAEAQATHGLDPTVFVVGGGAVRGNDKSFWAEVDRADADGPLATTAIGDTATLLFTSGTSGTPKACNMTHAAFVSVMPYVKSVLGATRDSVVFSTSDPAWAFGLYSTGAAVMALGVPRVMYSGRFVPEAWHRVIREEKATILTTAPAALRRLTATFAQDGVPPTLRAVAAAGEPLTAAVAAAWAETGAPAVRNGYGLSEVGMLLGDTQGTEPRSGPGWMSATIPGFDTFLADRDGQPVAEDQPGLIAVRRPRHQMSSGYENAADLWADRWRGDVFLTEDRAVTDPEGRWQVLGRDDDMIIASGHNISPVEVENALLQHPAVADAAAVAYDDPIRGGVVRVVVVRADARDDDGDLVMQLKQHVAQRVGPYAAPKVVDFRPELPRTEVGKLRRAAVRELPITT
ncbi:MULTISPECIES: AMP-binding protein [unclassified Rhodococcus (in: high G+C Gram-positive bacteria)]|uniref:AMP-binding protein n=1 Tax=unclassified Rhodococcus (in: high G+C Gram-positive bacteria) TaxID=192944 RepID=UPI001639F809|nr:MULTISPECIES: AMP-binding protein [unclassified Rhodococcus (in: high G+C Gram-positive bacteria)]MBC2639037.1 AMP-binding protein [Rhodococcus sp. 3A]MBC2896221.1 AMP-binding protein [Rhodococcus sp. 4CII]